MPNGRKRKEYVWKHYRSSPDKSVMCNYCDHKYKLPNVTKMGNHLLNCDKCPAIIKLDIKTKIEKNVTITTTKIPDETTPNHQINTLEPGSSNQNKRSLIDDINANISMARDSIDDSLNKQVDKDIINRPSTSHYRSLNEEEIEILMLKFAKAVIISGSPLNIGEHPLWKDFLKFGMPSFPIPSRKYMSTNLLDKVHNQVKKDVTENLRSTSYLHLQCDAWTNVNNEGIINFIISNPEPYFAESLCTTDNRHTSLYLSEELIKIMRTYGESKFVTLIGDNARNLQKAFELVKNKYPQIVPLNCIAHTLNLLTHDIIKCDVINGIIDLSVDVIKTIKKSQVLTASLKKIIKEKKTGETLKLPAKTRWGSHVAALRSIKNTKTALLALAIDETSTQLPQEIKSTILDDNFWTMIENCLLILEPSTGPIFQLESNKCNIHNVYTIFKDIKSKLLFILPDINILSHEHKQHILDAVEKRTIDCIKPIHLAAYLLDPRTQGVELNENEDLEAMGFIEQMAESLQFSVISDIADYKARDGFWRSRFLWEKVDTINPVTWWKGLCSAKALSKIAVRILTAPCTSAATERSFSKHGHIHSRKRNRLMPERAAKIAFASYNWDLLNKYKYNYSDEESEEHESHDDLFYDSEDYESNVFTEEEQQEYNILPGPSRPEVEFLNCDSITDSNDD